MHCKREGYELAPGITFLGRSGIKEIKKLKVAFVSGKDPNPHTENELKIKGIETIYTDNNFAQNDVEGIADKCKEGNIDLLLACGWPFDVMNSLK